MDISEKSTASNLETNVVFIGEDSTEIESG